MGISGLRDFLKSKSINFERIIPLHKIKGRIVIDALNWIFTYIHSVGKKVINEHEDIFEDIDQQKIYIYMIEEYSKFNSKFLEHNIVPIWIWDGVSQDNKMATKVSRKKSRQRSIDKMNLLKEQLLELNPFERPPELLEEYRKLLSRNIRIERSTIDKIKKFSKDCGLPSITSEDEAENLGASLCVDKRVKAIWSADTDTYPLGAPLVIKGFEYSEIDNQTVISIKGVFTSIIKKELKLNNEEFRDFCIMIGTDFNERMPGIGPARSYTLIDKYRNIENIEKETKHNTSCLKQEEVRGQLSPYNTEFITDEMLEINKNNIEVEDCFNENYLINSLIVKIKNN